LRRVQECSSTSLPAAAAGLRAARRRPLLICPPPVGRLDPLDDEFEGATEKSRRLAGHYAAAAAARSCAFLDAGSVISSSDVDGIHLEASEHERLGLAVAEQVRLLPA
jgi:lysophospholipase L1-like esterase